EGGELLGLWHSRGPARHAREHHALRNFGDRQLATERCRGRRKRRNARGERIRNGASPEPAQLLRQRTVDRQVAGMQSGDVEARGVCRHELGFDLIEIHGRGIHDARAGGTMGQQLGRYDRSGVEAYRTAGEEVAPANGDKIGRAWARPDEMHGHGRFLGTSQASARAQVTEPMAMRETKSLAVGPAAASAAVSASEGTPRSASNLAGLVRVPEAASSRSRCGTGRRGTPSPDAAPAIPASVLIATDVAMAARASAGTPQWASAARMAACTSRGGAPLRQPTPATITSSAIPIASPARGGVTPPPLHHGRAGTPTGLAPERPGMRNGNLDELAAEACPPLQHQRFGFERH